MSHDMMLNNLSFSWTFDLNSFTRLALSWPYMLDHTILLLVFLNVYYT